MAKQLGFFGQCRICGRITLTVDFGLNYDGRQLKMFKNYCGFCYWKFVKPVRRHLTRARSAKVPATLTPEEWAQTIIDFDLSCVYCGEKLRLDRIVVEHFMPITLGGGTTANNCVPSCFTCNASKSNTDPLCKDTQFWFAHQEKIPEIKKYLDTRRNSC